MATPPVITRTTWTDAPPDGSATVINNSKLQEIYDKIDNLVTRIITVRKNSAGSDFQEARLNFIEGSNVTLTVADDTGNGEVDITIAAAGALAATTHAASALVAPASSASADTVLPTQPSLSLPYALHKARLLAGLTTILLSLSAKKRVDFVTATSLNFPGG